MGFAINSLFFPSCSVAKSVKFRLNTTMAMNNSCRMDFGVKIASGTILKEINNNSRPKNLLFSPLSIHIALNMLANGLDESKLIELLEFLELKSIDHLNDHSSLLMQIATRTGGPVISLALGIWVDHFTPIKPDFKWMAETIYKAKAESVSFEFERMEVVVKINTWAREVSNGHIHQLVSPKFSPAYPTALLVTAIHFDGIWLRGFHASSTKHGNFHLLNGQAVSIPFMRKSNSAAFYGSFEGFKLLKM